MGLCNYYRRFIQGYSTIARPLTDLLRNPHGRFGLDDVAHWAFQRLKDVLVAAPILRLHDPDLPSRVLSDASDFATGAILE